MTPLAETPVLRPELTGATVLVLGLVLTVAWLVYLYR